MKFQKPTRKRSTIIAIAVGVACVAALVGATFAWFTDTASTSTNVIQAGNLSIELQGSEDAGATWNSIEGQTIKVKKAQEQGDPTYVSLSTILWEPGASFELQPIKIVNTGNLAVKFKAVINEASALQDGDADLASVIDVKVGGTTVGTLRQLIDDQDGFAYGTLAASESSTQYTITLVMQEGAGNEYQDTCIGGTGFSITVYATQASAESDSFGNTYDKDATYDTAKKSYSITFDDYNWNRTPHPVLDSSSPTTIEEGGTVTLTFTGNFTGTFSLTQNGAYYILSNGSSLLYVENATVDTWNKTDTTLTLTIKNPTGNVSIQSNTESA